MHFGVIHIFNPQETGGSEPGLEDNSGEKLVLVGRAYQRLEKWASWWRPILW
jgi:hypothetical protein